MPTRSIKVKLFLPRGEAGQSLRQSLWATHAAINAATKFYEQQLLLMRGESYVTGDEEVEEAAVSQTAPPPLAYRQRRRYCRPTGSPSRR